MSWPPALSARWTALALFLFALGLHLFVATGGLLVGVEFRTLIVLDELGAILFAPLLFALMLRLDLRDAFALRSAHWGHYAMAGAAAIPLQLFGGAVMELVIATMPSGDRWRELIEGSLDAMTRVDTPGQLVGLLVGAVVLAAVCEEILFRGLMLQLLARGGRWWGPIGITALLFALFHLDPVGLLPRALMGVYFGLLVWRSGSIFPAMLAHGANNLLAFAVQPWVTADGPAPQIQQVGLLAAASGLAFAGMLYAYARLAPPASMFAGTSETGGLPGSEPRDRTDAGTDTIPAPGGRRPERSDSSAAADELSPPT